MEDNEINFNNELEKAFNIIKTPRGDFEQARLILNDLIQSIIPIIEPNIKIISVNNIIEYYIFNNRFNNDKKYTVIDEPVHRAYYYIALSYINEKDYDEAIKNLKKSIAMNPYDSLSYFELVDLYKIENEYKKMYITLFELYKYIYKPDDLASFYIELGDYFYREKNYNFANILYSYSTFFNQTSYVEKVLTQIGLDLKRQLILNSKEECINYLNQYKFPINAVKENIDKVYELYNASKNHPEDYELRIELKDILYKITNNELFEDRITLKNTQFNFLIKIPEKWKVLDRTQFNKRSTGNYTIYVIEVTNNVVINLDIIKNITEDNLIKEYELFRNFVINQGFNVVLESEIAANNIKYIQSITQKKLLNDFVNMIHCIFFIRNVVVDLTVPTLKPYNEENIQEAYKDENVIRLNKIINSIEFL